MRTSVPSQAKHYAPHLRRQELSALTSTRLASSRERKRRKVTICQSQQSNVEHKSAIPADRQLSQLRSQLKDAVRLEEYAKAAELRDKILAMEEADPVLKLEAQLKAAIESQLFEEAAKCRDELLKLRPERKMGPPLTPPPPTLSDTLTNGVRVQVKSAFLPYRSRPGQFVFMYRVRIVNEAATAPIKLHRRHWIVTDANSYQDQIRGEGVLGEQPELAVGEEHIYSSYVPIRTSTGKMVGSYYMQMKNEAGEWQDAFSASVGVFGLDMSDATPAKW